MPSYTFEDRKGRQYEMAMSFKDVPAIGLEFKGPNNRLIHRVADYGSIQIGARVGNIQSSHAFVSQQVPRWHKGAPRHDKQGRAIFNTKKEIDDFVSASGGTFVRDRDCGSETHLKQYHNALKERQATAIERLSRGKTAEAVRCARAAAESLSRAGANPTKERKSAIKNEYMGNLRRSQVANEKALGERISTPTGAV